MALPIPPLAITTQRKMAPLLHGHDDIINVKARGRMLKVGLASSCNGKDAVGNWSLRLISEAPKKRLNGHNWDMLNGPVG